MFHETNLFNLLDSMIEIRKKSDDVESLRKIKDFIELLPMKVFINNEISMSMVDELIEDLNESIKFYGKEEVK